MGGGDGVWMGGQGMVHPQVLLGTGLGIQRTSTKGTGDALEDCRVEANPVARGS